MNVNVLKNSSEEDRNIVILKLRSNIHEINKKINEYKVIIHTLHNNIEQINNIIYDVCCHKWIIDSHNYNEHTEYICTNCNASK
jgi:hypothetical protein